MGNLKEQPLQVENSLDLLLVLLYAPGKEGKMGEPIDGITRLQKLIFLLKQGNGPKKLVEIAKEQFKFKPYKMGPYAESLQGDIDELLSVGLLQTERLRYLITDDGDMGDEGIEYENHGQKNRTVESVRYSLTKLGMKFGKELWESMNEKSQQELIKLKAFFGALSLRQLLILVYERYPNMTGESEIREELGF